MAISTALKQFWASNTQNVVMVNTFSIELVNTGTDPETVLSTYYICDYGDTFTATLEDGITTVAFLPAPMSIKLSEKSNSTEQTLHLVLDSLDGQVYDLVKQAASLDRRKNVIRVRYRIYLDSDTSQPAQTPVMEFTANSITCKLETISFKLSVKNLPTVLAGEYYTTDRFPGLRY